MSEDLVRELLGRILAADRRSANDLIEEWADVNGYEQVIAELLEPALDLFGEKWVRGEDVSLAQGYIAAKVAEDVLTKAAEAQSLKPSPSESMGPVVLGNIEDDYHALGRKMVATFLRTAGWKVVDLGTDVLPEDFINKALEVEAKVIGVSAMMDMTAVNIRKVRDEIDRRNLTGRIQLAVGGAVFKLRPELVAEVGGDGTATNAMATPDLMTRLWGKAEKTGGR
jgi:methylmalonyl-CoA mutase cobalamin-binding domain/chain